MSSLREILQAEFPPDQVLQRPGRGGGPSQDYTEDETVMDRLDDGLGVGGWSLLVEPISLADGVAKIRLGIKVNDEWVWYEDFGYANNVGGDALKEAVTDGIRRVARMPGVARYLYKKHTPVAHTNGTGRGAPSSTPRPAAAPPRTSTAVPDVEFPPNEWEEPTQIKPATGGWTFKQLAEAAEAKGIAKNAIYQTADKLFGKGAPKVTDLSPAQREQIAFEMGL